MRINDDYTDYKVAQFTYQPKVLNTEVDEYDLDIRVTAQYRDDRLGGDQLITSKSLCTPGCGHTGTYNSFCC